MAYIALAELQDDGVIYNPGDVVPAEDWPSRFALKSLKRLVEVPDEELTDEQRMQMENIKAQHESMMFAENPLAIAILTVKETNSIEDLEELIETDEPEEVKEAARERIAELKAKAQHESLTADQKAVIKSIHEMNVENLTKAVNEIEDLAVLNHLLEKDTRKTAKEVIQERIEVLSGKGE